MSKSNSILIVNPIIDNTWEIQVKNYVEGLLEKRRKVIVKTILRGPKSIECYYDLELAANGVLELIQEVLESDENFDAIIINCFGDPGLEAVREICNIPVIGPGESSLLYASLLGDRISIVSISKEEKSWIADPRLITKGMEGIFASFRGTGLSPSKIVSEKDYVFDVILQAAKRAVEIDGANVIVLGCTGMAELAKQIEKEINVPVVEPLACAVGIAEILIDSQLSHSKILAYREPPKKVIRWERG
ncbi:MAG: allantoin racemase [Candidatus Petromonas sp.]|nr:allantoin racemase [Candidatus Petromonas sp.]MDN5300645.1 allantoin racemase [Thermoanaerobacteraceae bacterium]